MVNKKSSALLIIVSMIIAVADPQVAVVVVPALILLGYRWDSFCRTFDSSEDVWNRWKPILESYARHLVRLSGVPEWAGGAAAGEGPCQVLQAMEERRKGVRRDPRKLMAFQWVCFYLGFRRRFYQPLRGAFQGYLTATEGTGLWRAGGAVLVFAGCTSALAAFIRGNVLLGGWLAVMVIVGLLLGFVGHLLSGDAEACASRLLGGLAAGAIAHAIVSGSGAQLRLTGLVIVAAGIAAVVEFSKSEIVWHRVWGFGGAAFMLAAGAGAVVGLPVVAVAASGAAGGLLNNLLSLGFYAKQALKAVASRWARKGRDDR